MLCKHYAKERKKIAMAYTTTILQYYQGKYCNAKLPKENRDCYSRVAASSSSFLRAYYNNKIANQGWIAGIDRNAHHR
jgi:hypothetical protein